MGGGQRVDARADEGGHGDVAGALGAVDREGDDRAVAVEAGELSGLLEGVRDLAQLAQAGFAAAGEDDAGVGEAGDAVGTGQGADGLLLAAQLGAATGEVDVGGGDLAVDVAGGDAEGGEAVGVQRHADLAGDAADALDLAHAAHALQVAHHDVVDEPGELLQGHGGGGGGVGLDRLADDVDAVDDGLLDGGGQVGADARQRVLDVVERAVGADLQAQLDHGERGAVGHGGLDVLDAGDARDGVLDLAGDLGFQLGGGGAGLGDRDGYHRNVDVGGPGDRHPQEADGAEHQQHGEQHQGGDGPADRGAGDVEGHGLSAPTRRFRRRGRRRRGAAGSASPGRRRAGRCRTG